MMITFSRLLELSGQKLLTEALTPREATTIFKYHGATDADLSDAASLKKARKRLMLANHPDRAGAEGLEAAKEINAAYDTLKNSGASQHKDNSRNGRGYERARPKPDSEEKNDEDTTWSMAGYSGGMRPMTNIYRHDYRDINFIKKTMWEKSGHSRTAYTIINFDGRYTRGTYTAYGSPEIFDEMAKAMIAWDDFFEHRAIFAQRAGGDLLLIYSDGKFHHPAIVIPTDEDEDEYGKRRSIWNNTQFREYHLPEILDKIRNKAD